MFLLDVVPGRYAAIDGLRAVAALMVFVFHGVAGLETMRNRIPVHEYATRSIPEIAHDHPLHHALLAGGSRLFIGVDVFFFLSGFLVWRMMERQGTSLTWLRFFARRLLRIYPAFAVSMFVAVLVNVTYPDPARIPITPLRVVTNLLMLFGNPWIPVESFNTPVWTLFWEMSFYAVAPSVFVVVTDARRWPRLPDVVRVAFASACVVLFAEYQIRTVMFVLGILVAVRSDDDLRTAARALRGGWVALAAAVTVASYMWFGDSPILLPVLGFSLSVVFTKVVFDDGPVSRLLVSRPARAFGTISYSFYLLHGLMLSWVPRFTYETIMKHGTLVSLVIHLGSCFLTSTIGAVVLYLVAERWYFVGRHAGGASTSTRLA
ncbi:MAG: acyltransferase [Polyangiaceae bacterium]